MATTRTARPGPIDRIRSAGITAWALIGILLLAYGVIRFLSKPLSVVVAPVAIALVVVYLLNPLVNALERRGVRRGLGVLLIYVGFLAIVSTLLSLLIPIIARQTSAFIDELPRYINEVTVEVNEFAARRGLDFRLTGEGLVKSIQDNRSTIIAFLGGVGSFAGQILHVLVTVVIGLILSIYLLLDLPKIQRGVTGAIPSAHRDEVVEVLDKIGSALGGFFRGQLFVATFVGVASALGLTLVKLPFAVLIGVIAGIFNLVPLIGPFLAAVPAIAVGLLSDDPSLALKAAVVLLIVQQIDNHVISPNVMGRTVQLHPVTVMLALLAGATVAGIFGMLVVIPLVAAAKILLIHFVARGSTPEPVADVLDAVIEPDVENV